MMLQNLISAGLLYCTFVSREVVRGQGRYETLRWLAIRPAGCVSQQFQITGSNKYGVRSHIIVSAAGGVFQKGEFLRDFFDFSCRRGKERPWVQHRSILSLHAAFITSGTR